MSDVLTIKSDPTFPVPAEIEGVKVLLHADGSAEGDANALAAKLGELRGPAHQGTVLAWQVMSALRHGPAARPAAAAARPAPAAKRRSR